MIRLTLKPGRDESVRRRHPWLFSGAVASAGGDGSDGRTEIFSSRGELLARGAYSPDSQIIGRLWTFDGRLVDADLFRDRFLAARRLRDEIIPPETTGYRLVNSEGDACPGVLLDRYGDVDVLELLTGGTEKWEPELTAAVQEVFSPAQLIVRHSAFQHDRGSGRRDVPVSESEPPTPNLEISPLSELASPDLRPSVPAVAFTERGLKFFADIARGQKTGFFLDQRDNRAKLRSLAANRTVLNLFSYSGGFSVAALAGGALRAVDVDSSEPALALARRHRQANDLPAQPSDFVRAEVFEDLRHRAEAGESWDVVICDPPAFARKRADLDRAARGYKDVNRLAMKLVSPEGWLLTCSCSGLVDASLFQKIVFSASLEADRSFTLVARQGAGADHPVSLDCPEGEYLKGLWLKRSD